MSNFRRKIMNMSQKKDYVKFEDPEVERICIENWSKDGKGITESDILKITTLSNKFSGNQVIRTFNEFEKFINVSYIGINDLNLSQGTFYKTSLTAIKLPSTLTDIRNASFHSSENLESINLENIVNIGKLSFYKCTSLNIEINLSNLESINSGAFNQSGITGINNLGKLKKLLCGDSNYYTNSPFGYCKSLTYVNIPDTIDEIQQGVFYQCTALEIVKIMALTPPILGVNVFTGTSANLKIYVPDESVEAYKAATNWSNYADKIHPMSEL